MLIRKASFKKLHGHIDLELSFKSGVNVLIGVNGSGKTTILNALAWTLSPASIQGGVPAAYLLSNLEFEEIRIAYTKEKERKYQYVRAFPSKDKEAVLITVSEVEGVLEIPIVQPPEPATVRTRGVSEPEEFFARYFDDQRSNPVLQYLSELPGPLYLPLDRRWPETTEVQHRPSRYRRSLSAGYLPIGNVLALAELAQRREQFVISELNADLRQKILSSLFDQSSYVRQSRIWTVDEVSDNRRRIVTALSNLGVREPEDATKEYFERAEEISEKLGGLSDTPNRDDPNFDLWVEWFLRISPLTSRVESLLYLIEENEEDRLRATQQTHSFLASVNSFLSDSGKALRFSDQGDLIVELGERVATASHLSSGELQLLILFTFLYFQFGHQQEFTIIIDEPELSLHLAWQSRYLETITEANPLAQFIIATHSPEIAAPFESRTIDISLSRR